MINYLKKVVSVFFCLIFSQQLWGQNHPSLMLTKANVAAVKQGCASFPILKSSYQNLKIEADKALNISINVPTPKDGGGGFTHEQHKKNYTNILNCATVYQISGEKKYADYVKNLLKAYADKYETWPIHPKSKTNKEGGRMFWQSLNDFVWQVYTIQGYDLVYDAISSEDRKYIETKLFMPILKFFTEDRKDVLDKIHNHGTWNLTAVGMTGYVLNKREYVEMALKGSAKDGKTGYYAQINQLFSPDGYYMEGPYYQRYSLLPFVLFAKAINNYQPELKIFEYRNKLLAKAIQTALQLTYTNKAFFPINDAIKDKTYESIELVYGLNLAYADISADADLLDVAQQQQRVIVSDAGLKVAKAIAVNKAQPFKYKSLWIKDGKNGDEGGVGVLRYGNNADQIAVLLKAASQGMGHGHFDRLNLLFYDHNTELFADYGSARFLNIDTKGGGNYLPENETWAKQTIAHNTVAVDQSSNYNGILADAEAKSPELLYFSNNPNLQVISAKEDNAFNDVKMRRTIALIKTAELQKPILVDVFNLRSSSSHQYDLPFYYKGQLVNSSFQIKSNPDHLQALGTKNGYQHLWLNAEHKLAETQGSVTILNQKRFYTTHFTSEKPLTFKLVSIGANDPNMNLLDGKAFMLTQNNARNQTYVNIMETHGQVDPINESVAASTPSITELKLLRSTDEEASISFKINGKLYQYNINYQDQNNYITFK